MGKRRKLAAVSEEKENNQDGVVATTSTTTAAVAQRNPITQGPMYTIFSSAQLNETLHKRYVKEMQQLYTRMDHDAFMFTYIKMLKSILEAEDVNEHGTTALLFCAKFVTSFDNEEGAHPVLSATFKWLLSTISNSPHIRYRLCYYVNLILKEFGLQAALDDEQCDNILEYMLQRLVDISPLVRKQAVLAMQRLQVPDNPDDPVLRAYEFHLCSDPSPSVRQCIISCMGRNYHTIPYILDRLWDIDEKVRRHTYMNMCSYPVRSYKVSQRLTLLEQGLNDTSEGVRKTAIKYMLKQWLESYDKNPIALTAALKLDSNEEEMERFRKVAQQMLLVIFAQTDNLELISHLDLAEEGEMYRCVPQDKMNVEVLLYWQTLYDYLLDTQASESDLVVPELSTFCLYIEKFSEHQTPEMDKFAQIEFQYMMLPLMNLLRSYDLGDETGRGNMKKLLTHLLKDCLLDHKIIKIIVQCAESLMTNVEERFQYFLEIIYEICELNTNQCDLVHDRNLLSKLLDNLDNFDLKTKISALKVKILDLEEQEQNFSAQKEYIRAQAKNDERNAATEEYMALLKPLLEKEPIADLPQNPKLSKQESILKGLFITFYMVASESVQSLNPTSCKLFRDFICRHMASNENDIREWAIKCGTAYSLLYESIAKEVFDSLYTQFYKSNNLRVWDTSVNCIFELLDHYGVDNFSDVNEQTAKRPRQGRQLYNTLEHLDIADDTNVSANGDQGVGVIYMMSHFLDKCEDLCIRRSIVKGFCRLVLRQHLKDRTDILEKLLKVYFDPRTDTSINQILGVFFEHLVDMKLQSQLQPCLFPMLLNVMNANFDSPLHEVSPETITKFFIDITLQEKSTEKDNIHNKIALNFLQEILNNAKEHKDICRVLAKEIITLNLNLGDNLELKEEIKVLVDKLIKLELDPRTIKYIVKFKDIINGIDQPPLRNPENNDSDEECDSETVTTASEYTNPIVNVAETERTQTTNDEVQSTQRTTIEEQNMAEEEQHLEAATTVKENENACNEPTTVHSEVEANETTTATITPTEITIIPTTFGHDNRLGIMSLRRSLQKSISQSDNESLSEATQTVRQRKTQQKEQQKQIEIERAQAITRRNLRRFPTKVVTPEKKVVDEKTVSSSSSDNEEHNSSEVIPPSPTATTPAAVNGSRLRLRATRNNQLAKETTAAAASAATSNKKQTRSQTSTAASKQSDNENATPVRNGRKRILRKTPPPTAAAATTLTTTKTPKVTNTAATATEEHSTDNCLSQSPPTISPLRKQQRTRDIDAIQTNPALNLINASPTESASSSKENDAPARMANSKNANKITPARQQENSKTNESINTTTAATASTTKTKTKKTQSKNNPNVIGTPSPAICSTPINGRSLVTTRNSARIERINNMCMTRKRLSIELNTSSGGGHVKLPKPKRMQREKTTNQNNCATKTPQRKTKTTIRNNCISSSGSGSGSSNKSSSGNEQNSPTSSSSSSSLSSPQLHVLKVKQKKLTKRLNVNDFTAALLDSSKEIEAVVTTPNSSINQRTSARIRRK